MKFAGSLTGVKQIELFFDNMPRATQRKIYRKALRAGAAPVRDAAQVNIASVSKKFTGIAQRRGTIRIYSLKLYRGMYRVAVMVKRGLVNPAKRGKDGGPVRVGLYLAVLEYGSDKLGRAPKSWIRKAELIVIMPRQSHLRRPRFSSPSRLYFGPSYN